MPKRPISHENDSRAVKKLLTIFPDRWIPKDPRDMISGREYGQDIVFEIITENREPTGAEVVVQNKVIETKQSKISTTLTVDGFRYLQSLAKPVILHIYHIITDTSYWLWLHNYVPDDVSKLDRQKTLKINIPKRNILSIKDVPIIERYVLQHHFFHNLQNKVILQNRIDQHFSHVFEHGEQFAGIKTYSKHANSLEQNPIQIHMQLKEEASQEFDRALKRGEAKTFSAEINVTGVPNWFGKPIDGEAQISVIPHIELPTLHLRLDFYNQQNEKIFETNFVEMQPTNDGSMYKRWVGTTKKQVMSYELTFDREATTGEFLVNLNGALSSTSEIKKYHQALDTLEQARRIRITDLDNDISFSVTTDKPVVASVASVLEREFVDALLDIEKKLKITINVPEVVQIREIEVTKAIRQIFYNGIAHNVNPIGEGFDPKEGEDITLLATVELATARLAYKELSEKGYVVFQGPYIEETWTLLLNQQLNLGRSRHIFFCIKLINEKEVKEIIENQNLAPDTTLQMNFLTDKERNFVEFSNWNPIPD